MLPEGLYYERFAPVPALAYYVEHFRVVRGPPLAEARQEILIPNGRPTILCCLGGPGGRRHIRSGSRTLNSSNVSGLITEPILLEQRGRSLYAAAQLTPWGLGAMVPGRMLVDDGMPLEDWAGADAAGTLLAVMATQEVGEPMVRVLEAFLLHRLRPLPDNAVGRLRAAIGVIEEVEGLLEVEQLASRIGATYPALYRLFKAHRGVT